MAGEEPQDPPRGTGEADDEPRPAERLRARAEATDRATRFEQRLLEVRRIQGRRRMLRRAVRVGWAVVFAGLGALAPLVLAAVLGGADPTGQVVLVAAIAGGVVGGVGPSLRNWVARRRGAKAWDAYNERYVLLGDPSAEVRDADRAQTERGGPPPPDQGR